MRAIDIITDAYESCNRLSPGESLSADDAAFGLRRLNLLVDELSASALYLFKSVQTSAPQSGPITLGVGVWAAVSPGDTVVSAAADNIALSPITMQQYNEIYAPNVTGRPTMFAQDGLNTVYLWPVPTGHTVKILTQDTVSAFADQLTDYTMPGGWAAALGAGLAVRIASVLMGNVPPSLVQAERGAMDRVEAYRPKIIGVGTFTRNRTVNPLRLF